MKKDPADWQVGALVALFAAFVVLSFLAGGGCEAAGAVPCEVQANRPRKPPQAPPVQAPPVAKEKSDVVVTVERMRRTGYGNKEMIEVNRPLDDSAVGVLITPSHRVYLNGKRSSVDEVWSLWESMAYPWLRLTWKRADNSYRFEDMAPPTTPPVVRPQPQLWRMWDATGRTWYEYRDAAPQPMPAAQPAPAPVSVVPLTYTVPPAACVGGT